MYRVYYSFIVCCTQFVYEYVYSSRTLCVRSEKTFDAVCALESRGVSSPTYVYVRAEKLMSNWKKEKRRREKSKIYRTSSNLFEEDLMTYEFVCHSNDSLIEIQSFYCKNAFYHLFKSFNHAELQIQTQYYQMVLVVAAFVVPQLLLSHLQTLDE